ncbi:hypothetical protein BC828DRAFT_196449 [Blastocladiella britannica]|nr:hypothetical protein BC828DRAFT_196449 [Blastocladiella britannica]
MTTKSTPTAGTAVAKQVPSVRTSGKVIAGDVAQQAPVLSVLTATRILVLGKRIDDLTAAMKELPRHRVRQQFGSGKFFWWVGPNDIVVAGIDKLQNAANWNRWSIKPKEWSLIIILNATSVCTMQVKEILKRFHLNDDEGRHINVLGYGSTLERYDGKSLTTFFKDLQYGLGIQEGMSMRVLRQLNVYKATLENNSTRRATIANVTNNLVKHPDHNRIVLFVDSYVDADKIVESINKCWTAPVAAKWLAAMTEKDQKAVVRDYNAGRIRVLVKISSTKDIGLEHVDVLGTRFFLSTTLQFIQADSHTCHILSAIARHVKSHQEYLNILLSVQVIGPANTPLSIIEFGTAAEGVTYQNVHKVLAYQAKCFSGQN